MTHSRATCGVVVVWAQNVCPPKLHAFVVLTNQSRDWSIAAREACITSKSVGLPQRKPIEQNCNQPSKHLLTAITFAPAAATFLHVPPTFLSFSLNQSAAHVQLQCLLHGITVSAGIECLIRQLFLSQNGLKICHGSCPNRTNLSKECVQDTPSSNKSKQY